MKIGLDHVVRLILPLAVSLTLQAQTPLACTSKSSLVVGGFTSQRAGSYSFIEGAYYSQARAAVAARFPNVTFEGFTTMDASSLVVVDILIIGSAADRQGAIEPLSEDEQGAVMEFVRHGGSAVVFADNSTFDPSAPAANEAVLAPFGVQVDGTVGGFATATVTMPSSHPVTRGPFGSVAAFGQVFPGGLTDLGPYAVSLATNQIGVALAVIEAGMLGPGAGRVVIYSDHDAFADTTVPGAFSQNEALFLNTFDYCRKPLCGPIATIRCSQVEICWNATVGASYQVQYRSDLTPPGWMDLGAAISAIGEVQCVTDDVPFGQPQRSYRVVVLP
ncbi:MAG: hypothetical protein KF833_04545 [Verrucomicrobiae bacterium]|nr:hypothetical protein [Verrucomicrobiae bacterium]